MQKNSSNRKSPSNLPPSSLLRPPSPNVANLLPRRPINSRDITKISSHKLSKASNDPNRRGRGLSNASNTSNHAFLDDIAVRILLNSSFYRIHGLKLSFVSSYNW
jgi:hypothetical protein